MDKMRIGVIGCGNISDIYLKNLSTRLFLVNALWWEK